MSRSIGSAFFDAIAAASRALPHFRGKWQLVDVLRRMLRPLVHSGDSLRTVRMKDGSLMTWDLRDAAEGRAAWLGLWDDALRDAVLQRLPADAVILDVGASVGAWTIPMARRLAPAGLVYAFEPVPANRQRLEESIAANSVRNVRVSAVALGDSTRDVDMWLRSSQTGADSGTAAVVEKGAGHLTVSMLPLDEWAAREGVERLDFMKLDVEGAEFFVLAGAEKTLARFRPLILAEFDDYWISTHGRTSADVVRWAEAHSYRLLAWDRHRRRFVPAEAPGAEETLLIPADHG